VEIEENRVSYVAALRKNRPGDMEGKNVWEEGVGIALRVGRGATARYNRVSHTSYTGIRLLKLGEPGACTIAITENEIEDIEPHPFGSGNGHEHGQGIAGGMFSAGATIEGNQVARVAFGVWLDSSYGGACGASKALVSRNRIEDVRKGIFFERSTRECVAMRNVVLRADVGISLGTREQYAQEQLSGAPHDTCWGGDGEGVFSSAGHRVLHNTVVDAEQGIALGYALAPDVRDNIVSGHGATGIVVTDATLQAHADAGTALGPVDYNLYDVPSGLVGRWLESDCPSLETWQQASGTALDSHSLIGGPKFVSPDTGDFALQPSSPARDAGVDVGVGGACGKPDIGAIELTAPCQ
jgi:hypothetical protein